MQPSFLKQHIFENTVEQLLIIVVLKHINRLGCAVNFCFKAKRSETSKQNASKRQKLNSHLNETLKSEAEQKGNEPKQAKRKERGSQKAK
jgi:hypothetical protein